MGDTPTHRDMSSRRRQRDRDGYYDERQPSYSSSYSSSNYVEGSDRPKQAAPPQPPPQPTLPITDYGTDIHYSPPRSPNGAGSSSHSHYGQSHSRPYSRGHHRRRYNYSPEPNTGDAERDRDYKSTRDKYAERAPAEAKEEGERERPAHDKNPDTRKHSKGTKRVWNPSGSNGDWSEHISSSGKKYYYNCVSEVSQWEKPREWHEKRSKYSHSSSGRAGHERREPRSEREPERVDRSERPPHKRTGVVTHTNTYWRNPNRPEYEEPRPRIVLPAVPEEPQPIPTVVEVRPRPAPLPVPEVVNYVRNDYDPRTFQQATPLPRIISHTTTNGSSMTPPPPPVETGPPTPTHSENHVDQPIVVELLVSRRYDFGNYGNVGTVATPALTPSLSNYMRHDLVDHVTGWPAEVLERQAQRYNDENIAYSKQITRVSAELKCARSIVREREIQATLQEQKSMYLRQQVIELEESMSQNSIMCDDLCQ